MKTQLETQKELNASIRLISLLDELEENNKVLIAKLEIITDQQEKINSMKDFCKR
jgi:hypothetical protein